jgi:hypothetical protein
MVVLAEIFTFFHADGFGAAGLALAAYPSAEESSYN